MAYISYSSFYRSINVKGNDSGDENFDDESSISSSIASGFSDNEEFKDYSCERNTILNSDDDIPENPAQKPKKLRKIDDFSRELQHQHQDFIPVRNEVIQKWNDKTRISSGRIKSSNFSAFDQSTLKQIEQILCDKNRLIKRTQTKRSVYKILGKNDSSEKAGEQVSSCIYILLG